MTDANSLKVELYAEAEIPTEFGNFLVSVYHNNKNDDETLLVSLNLDTDETPFCTYPLGVLSRVRFFRL